jgi:hypothetical protein
MERYALKGLSEAEMFRVEKARHPFSQRQGLSGRRTRMAGGDTVSVHGEGQQDC